MKKKIWIDLENSPHVPFFKPIVDELETRGYEVFLTARDCAQTCGLADLHQLPYMRIGRHYGRNKLLKVLGLLVRVLQMMPTIMRVRPALALSHGSRSQQILAWLLRIPVVTTTDYEHTQELPIAHPGWMIVPQVVSGENFNRKIRILKYPGIKEDIYVPRFRADGPVRQELNIRDDEIMVTIRPPATDAHYYVPESGDLFLSTVEELGRKQNVRMVVLPRNEKQRSFIEKTWPDMIRTGKIIMPEKVIDGLNLLWHSDLVISGGGTMNREAAALGIPVYSIFRGKIGAVDRYLADTGRLMLLETAEDVRTKIILASRTMRQPDRLNREALKSFVGHIAVIAESTP